MHSAYNAAHVKAKNPTMITLQCSSSISLSLNPRHLKPPHTFSTSLSNLKPLHHHHHHKNLYKKKGICRAELSHDAPFTAAIGACMLSSLLLPNTVGTDEDTESAINSTDTRFAVMGIVSFIPYFNWLSWVFAWLDTGKKRYAVYSLVYLAPYLRSNLSLSPEESWLPIASIVFCIIHIQLEASISNGDLQGFQLFSDAAKHLSSLTRKKDVRLKENEGISEESKSEHMEQSRNEIGQWGVPKKPVEHDQQLNGDWDDDKRRKH